MGDIKSLSFAMADSDYLMVSGMQNHYSTLVVHRLGPCLDVNKKRSESVFGRGITMAPVEETTGHCPLSEHRVVVRKIHHP
jgi:hypothetical protein